MNFIRKWFNRIIGWIAAPIAKTLDKAAELTAPLVARFALGLKVDWTFKTIGKVLLGALLVGALLLFTSAAVILSIVGFTQVLALVLPVLLANLLAVAGTLFVAYRVLEATKVQRADEIVVTVEVQA